MDDARLTRIERNQAAMAAKVDHITDELFGPAETDVDGQIVRVGGMKQDIADIKAQLGNGGIKIRIPVGIWVAVIGFMGTVIVALIGLVGRG